MMPTDHAMRKVRETYHRTGRELYDIEIRTCMYSS